MAPRTKATTRDRSMYFNEGTIWSRTDEHRLWAARRPIAGLPCPYARLVSILGRSELSMRLKMNKLLSKARATAVTIAAQAAERAAQEERRQEERRQQQDEVRRASEEISIPSDAELEAAQTLAGLSGDAPAALLAAAEPMATVEHEDDNKENVDTNGPAPVAAAPLPAPRPRLTIRSMLN